MCIRDREVYACFAPSIEGQFGGVSVGEMIRALQYLGFTDAMEVSLGADATAYYEAQEAKEVAREALYGQALSASLPFRRDYHDPSGRDHQPG